MTNETRHTSPDQAREALASVKRMRLISVGRLFPPRWARAAWSVCLSVALMLFTLEDGLSRWLGTLIFVGVMLHSFLVMRTSGVRREHYPGIWWSITVAFSGIGLFVIWFTTLYARQVWGLTWAPITGGVAAAVVVFAVLELEFRRWRTNEEDEWYA